MPFFPKISHASCLLLLSLPIQFASADYIMVDLGDFGLLANTGRITTFASAINDAGQVTGYVRANNTPGQTTYNAFLYTLGDGLKDLGTVPGGSSYPNAISDNGTIVGWGRTGQTSASPMVALRWNANSTQPEVIAPSNYEVMAVSVNDSGDAVGYRSTTYDPNSFSYNFAGAFWDSANNETPIVVPGLENAFPTAINNIGAIISKGSYQNSVGSGYFKANLQADPVIFQNMHLISINDSNQILAVDSLSSDWKIINNPGMPSQYMVDVPGGINVDWVTINDDGTLVGNQPGQFNSHTGIIYEWSLGGGMTTLNPQITEFTIGNLTFPSPLGSNWTAIDINDDGWIVGNYTLIRQQRAFLLMPTGVPELNSSVLLGVAFVLLIVVGVGRRISHNTIDVVDEANSRQMSGHLAGSFLLHDFCGRTFAATHDIFTSD